MNKNILKLPVLAMFLFGFWTTFFHDDVQKNHETESPQIGVTKKQTRTAKSRVHVSDTDQKTAKKADILQDTNRAAGTVVEEGVSDPLANRGEPVSLEDEQRLEAENFEGYPPMLYYETGQQMASEAGIEPTHAEIIAHLDEMNEQIHKANEELASHYEILKKHYEEGNRDAMEKLQLEIFSRNVDRPEPLPAPPENDYPPSWRSEEIAQFNKQQFEKNLELMKQIGTH